MRSYDFLWLTFSPAKLAAIIGSAAERMKRGKIGDRRDDVKSEKDVIPEIISSINKLNATIFKLSE